MHNYYRAWATLEHKNSWNGSYISKEKSFTKNKAPEETSFHKNYARSEQEILVSINRIGVYCMHSWETQRNNGASDSTTSGVRRQSLMVQTVMYNSQPLDNARYRVKGQGLGFQRCPSSLLFLFADVRPKTDQSKQKGKIGKKARKPLHQTKPKTRGSRWTSQKVRNKVRVCINVGDACSRRSAKWISRVKYRQNSALLHFRWGNTNKFQVLQSQIDPGAKGNWELSQLLIWTRPWFPDQPAFKKLDQFTETHESLMKDIFGDLWTVHTDNKYHSRTLSLSRNEEVFRTLNSRLRL